MSPAADSHDRPQARAARLAASPQLMKGNPGKCASFHSFSLATVTLVLMRRRKGQGLRVDFQVSLRERDPGFAEIANTGRPLTSRS
jgi:hypothetical protein